MDRLIINNKEGIDISDEIKLGEGKANPFGWSQYKILYNGEEIGWFENGEPKLITGYTWFIISSNDPPLIPDREDDLVIENDSDMLGLARQFISDRLSRMVLNVMSHTNEEAIYRDIIPMLVEDVIYGYHEYPIRITKDRFDMMMKYVGAAMRVMDVDPNIIMPIR
jgi:hypothetical protein